MSNNIIQALKYAHRKQKILSPIYSLAYILRETTRLFYTMKNFLLLVFLTSYCKTIFICIFYENL